MNYHLQSTDEQLIEGCKARNRLAQKYLYQKYFGRLFGIAMRYTRGRDEAEDVLNAGFLKIFDKIDTYDGRGAFAGWMSRIVTYTAIDHARSQKTYRETMDLNTERDQPITSSALENLLAEDIYRLIQQLPDTPRAVFSMYVIDGFKHAEIAEKLEISAGTSKWYLNQARKELQQMVKKQSLNLML